MHAQRLHSAHEWHNAQMSSLNAPDMRHAQPADVATVILRGRWCFYAAWALVYAYVVALVAAGALLGWLVVTWR